MFYQFTQIGTEKSARLGNIADAFKSHFYLWEWQAFCNIPGNMFNPATDDSVGDKSSSDAWYRPASVVILLLILIIVSFPDVVFGLRTFFYRDFGIFGYPLAFHHRESIWNGEIPLWNPFNNSGVPFAAQWNSMVFYPLSLFYVLFPLSWSLGVFCLLHLLLGGLGMYFLVYHWTNDRLAACLACVAFAFNGLTLSCLKWPNNISALGLMPWVVMLVASGWKQGGSRLIAAALVGAAQMLTGGPEIILFTWLMLLVYLAFETWSCAQNRWKQVRRFAGIVFLVTGLAAIQMMPFLDLLMHSQRGTGYSDASWSMPPWGWANLLVPLYRCFPSHQGVFAQYEQYWTASYYPGVGIFALSLLALQKPFDSKKRFLLFALLSGLLLALGPSGFLYSIARNFLPVMEIVRYPIKFVVLVSFALPVLAGIALSSRQKENSGSSNAMRLLVIVGAALAVIIGILIWHQYRLPLSKDVPDSVFWNGITRLAFLAIITGLIFLLRKSERHRRLSEFALVILVWLDLITHAPRLNPTVERWVYDPGFARRELKLDPEPAAGGSRTMVSPHADLRLNHLSITNATEDILFSRMALFANCNLLDRIPKVDGFLSLYPERENRLRTLLYSTTNMAFPNLMDFLGIAQVTADGKMIEWTRRTNALPLITGGQMPVFTDATETLQSIFGTSFSPRELVCLPIEANEPATESAKSDVEISDQIFSSHSIQFSVKAKSPSWIVVAQTYYHPWRAMVNNSPARIWPANYAYQAVKVPAGISQVKLVYEDSAFRAGCVISLTTLLACLWFYFRNKNQRTNPTNNSREHLPA